MKERLAALLFGVLASALLLGALEGGTRLLHPTPVPQPLITQQDERWEDTRRFDALLFWSLRPSLIVDGLPFTNSLGLRWPEVPPKSDSEFRILSLGESTTFARSIPFDANYSYLLQERLHELDGKRVRVINAGVPGYTLFQGVVYAQHRGLGLRPDAMLAYFGFNDFLPVAFRAQRDAKADAASGRLTDRELFAARSGVRFRLASWLLEHSHLYRLLAVRGHDPHDIVLDRGRPRVPESDRWELLGELDDLCRRHGIRLAIVIPWYRDFTSHIPLLRHFAEVSGVLTVDLPRLLESVQPCDRYFADAVHPTADGHRLIAEAIERALRQRWDSPGGDPGQRRPTDLPGPRDWHHRQQAHVLENQRCVSGLGPEDGSPLRNLRPFASSLPSRGRWHTRAERC